MNMFTDRVAFVTGAASGIGLGVAKTLAGAGARVMMCDRDEALLGQAVAELQRANKDVDGVIADVSLKPELEAAARQTLARYGRVDILVNNAGIGGGGRYGQWDDITWRWVMDVNLVGMVWGIEIFGPLIESHGEGGHIVCTASMAGLISPGSGAYGASKYAVVSMCEGLRRELARKGIGVSVLCPGLVRTAIGDVERNRPERFATADAPEPMTPRQAEKLRALVEHGVDPDYVGELVREGIEGDWAYIFTDLDYESAVEARFQAIKQGFDHIRGRKPRG